MSTDSNLQVCRWAGPMAVADLSSYNGMGVIYNDCKLVGGLGNLHGFRRSTNSMGRIWKSDQA